MKGSVLWASLGVLGLGGTVWAQAQPGSPDLERFQRQLEQIQRDTRLRVDTSLPPDQRALLDFGGYLSFNFYALDDVRGRTHILRQTDLLGYGRLSLDGVHEFFLRGYVRYDDFNTGQSFDGQGDETRGPELDRAYYRFDLKRYLAAYEGVNTRNEFSVTGGRQLIHWANGLTLSQILDGGEVTVGFGPVALTAIGGITPDLYSDIDPFRPEFDSKYDRGFYGGMLSVEVAKHRPFIYGLVQQDYNDQSPTSFTFGGAPTTVRFEYDSWYLGTGSRGSLTDQLVYGVELVYQGGSTLSSPYTGSLGAPTIVTQTEDDIAAWAADFQLDYLLTDANRTRLSAEVILASGDSDRDLSSTSVIGGNRTGTTDRAFNGFGLVNSGLAFSPRLSNLAIGRIGASTFPLPQNRLFNRMQVGTNLLVFSKLDGAAPIDEPTESEAFLGVEPDLFVNWQITSDLTFALRYGVFLPSNTIESSASARHFFFSGLTLGF